MADIKPPEYPKKPAKKHKETTLLDCLHVRAIQKKTSQGSAINQALFFANIDEIEEAIASKWSSKMIWEELRESKKFLGSYECFRRYVRRHLPRKELANPTKQATPPKPHTVSTQPSKASGEGFIFNPDAKTDDLV